MSPEEHYAEAERLLAIARKPIISGAPVGFSTHGAVAALARTHALLALYRPPMRVEVVQAGEPPTVDGDGPGVWWVGGPR